VIDYAQKQKELRRGVELLTAETLELLKNKRKLEVTNADLDRRANTKLLELKGIIEQIRTLDEQMTKVKTDLDAYRRQEIDSVASEVEKMRSGGV
jgi:hypothetical protein